MLSVVLKLSLLENVSPGVVVVADGIGHRAVPRLFPQTKDQENPNFSAFDTCVSLTNNPIFDPGRLGTRSEGTKISKFYTKPDNRS